MVRFLVPQYICLVIKCPLDITADDIFVASNGAVYYVIQAAYNIFILLAIQTVHIRTR